MGSEGEQSAVSLSTVVARGMAKLMAYKDEYEVARLYASPQFMKSVNDAFEGDVRLTFHLAPPLFSRRDPVTGHLRKREFGSWMMYGYKVLSRLRGLRGTPLDIFGYTQERRDERQWVTDYENMMCELLPVLSEENYEYALELAQLPDSIRGYGHVKEASMAAARNQQKFLLEKFRNPPQVAKFVELKVVG